MADVGQRKHGRVSGTTVFMTGSADGVIDEQVILLTVVTRDVPHVDAHERIMTRNARAATANFGLPYNQVVELGAQIEL
jgi:K+ transporter